MQSKLPANWYGLLPEERERWFATYVAEASLEIERLTSKVNAVQQAQYIYGKTYNNVKVAFEEDTFAAGTSDFVTYGIFIPYTTQDGTWRMRMTFNLFSSAQTTIVIKLIGVKWSTKFIWVTGQPEPLQALTLVANATGYGFAHTYLENTFYIIAPANSNYWSVSGDVELESKPTWAK